MKIEVFLRHCYTSKVNLSGANRPDWWDKEKVFQNFKNTLNPETTKYTIIYDEHYGKIEDTFLSQEKNTHIINCGGEAKSFIETLRYIQTQNHSHDLSSIFNTCAEEKDHEWGIDNLHQIRSKLQRTSPPPEEVIGEENTQLYDKFNI